MISNDRSRRLLFAALGAVSVLALAACSSQYPNTTFEPHSEFGRAIDYLWGKLIFWGTLVFLLVEGLLIYVVIRYRRREGQPDPEHVHGNTTLEIAWTLIPMVILALIAVPTVRTIFRTQAKAVPNALQVEVVGHQWWWEFRYPQYTTRNAAGRLDTLTTANELYLPIGRTANFALKTADVLHSFWVPQLGGKRDLITNHVNYLWFTPDSTMNESAWNGQCTEYCGASHANMRLRAFTVSPADFDRWVAHQQSPAAFGATQPPGTPPTPTSPGATPVATAAAARSGPQQPAVPPAATPSAVRVTQAAYTFPAASLPRNVVPETPLPAISIKPGLVGNPSRGQQIYSSSACIGCHMVHGNPMSLGVMGPNLTHIASRHTIAGGVYPNDTRHLLRWIKNARVMKAGVLMPTLGTGEYDPVTKQTVKSGLDDQQIADIVAYLQALK